jgi:hypothetical protein
MKHLILQRCVRQGSINHGLRIFRLGEYRPSDRLRPSRRLSKYLAQMCVRLGSELVLHQAVRAAGYGGPSHPLHQPEPARRQRQAVPADGGVFAERGHRTVSSHPSLHHLHMQRRRRQVHRGKADIPRGHAHLVIRPDMAAQHKGDAAGIKRRIGKIPLPRAGHHDIRICHRAWAKAW